MKKEFLNICDLDDEMMLLLDVSVCISQLNSRVTEILLTKTSRHEKIKEFLKKMDAIKSICDSHIMVYERLKEKK